MTHLSCAESPRRIAILLVDDQKFVGMAVGRLLATEPDIDLHCCLTAIEAIPRAEEIRPAMILQDLVMPDVDGLTMPAVSKNPSTLHTPIIVLSGDDRPDAAAQREAPARTTTWSSCRQSESRRLHSPARCR